jgi:HAD superfamily hydrolase (TIGR01509 family)
VMSIAALLFDVDGTLADTEETHRLAFNAAFAEHGLPFAWSPDEYEVLLRIGGGKERLAHYFAQLDVPTEERKRLAGLVPSLHARKNARYGELVAIGRASLRPGIARLIEEAEAAGVRLGIVSTTTKINATALLEATLGPGATARFAVIACGDVVPTKKPAPDIYHYALSALGVPAAEVVAFEDSATGLAAAKAAGLFTVVTPSHWTRNGDFRSADIVRSHLDDDERITLALLEASMPLHSHPESHRGIERASERDKTLSEFIIEEHLRSPGATGVFTSLLNGIRLSCQRIAWLIGQGKRQTALDRAAHDIVLRTLEPGGSLAAMSSEAMDRPHAISHLYPRSRYLLAFAPLHGAHNLDVNLSAGSVFSILRAPSTVAEPSEADFLQPGTEQVGAGYALYGPSTILVLTVGRGVHGFTLDSRWGDFMLTHPLLTVGETSRELAVNASNARFWEPALQRYVDECVQGKAGVRGKDFKMRWTASFVAEVHRVLVRGGLFISPADAREGRSAGRLRLLYEANPMAMLVEQAGGAASTGRGRILEVMPRSVLQRAPVILGSREEVLRLERYHGEQDAGLEREFKSPLFNDRSLFPSH